MRQPGKRCLQPRSQKRSLLFNTTRCLLSIRRNTERASVSRQVLSLHCLEQEREVLLWDSSLVSQLATSQRKSKAAFLTSCHGQKKDQGQEEGNCAGG